MTEFRSSRTESWDGSVPEARGPTDEEALEGTPVGTLFVLALFLLLMVGLWGTLFWMLLNR